MLLKSRNSNYRYKKYQKPNIIELVDDISQINAERKAGDLYFTILVFTYAYVHVALDKKNKQALQNFISERKIYGNVLLQEQLNGLISRPAEFQNVIDTLLKEFPQTNAFVDNLLVVWTGAKTKRISTDYKLL